MWGKMKKIVIFIKDFVIEYLSTLLYCIGIAFLFWIYEPSGTVSNKFFVTIVSALLIFVVIASKWVINCILNNKDKNIFSDIIVIDGNSILLQPSDLYSTDTIVSLYFKDGEFEKYMGYGYVETIQHPSKRVQIKVIEIKKNMTDVLKNTNKDQIIVKPLTTKNIIESIKEKNNE